jgi:hypothetical protein
MQIFYDQAIWQSIYLLGAVYFIIKMNKSLRSIEVS